MSPLDETIAKAVEQRSDRIVETLCDLVRFPSIVKFDPREAGPGERDRQLYLQRRLEALGFTTDLWSPTGLRSTDARRPSISALAIPPNLISRTSAWRSAIS
jgi:acetylornithine deacetylase/succinyl-diaminopimelate desuccinylase-like protein